MRILSGVLTGILITIMLGTAVVFSQGGPAQLGTFLTDLANALQANFTILLLLVVVTIALVYALGQAFGAETRARATVWATTLLAGVLFAIVIWIVFHLISSLFLAGIPQQYSSMAYVLGLVMTIMLIVILATYLGSKALKAPEWEAYLGIELGELLNSFLIIFFAIAFFEAANAIAATLAQGSISGVQVTSATEAAGVILQKNLKDIFKGITDIFSLQVCLSILNTFQRRIGEFVLTVTYKVFPGLDTFLSLTNVLGYGLITAYNSIYAQLAAVSLIEATMKTIFLPAGIMLRFFQPTRQAGVFLIAFAIGFQTVFPLTYVINQKILDDAGYLPYQTQALTVSSLCGGKYFVLGAAANPLFPISLANTPFIGTAFRTVFGELGINLLSPQEFLILLNQLALLSLPALFLPALSIAVTFSFINSLTKFLMANMG